MCNKFQVALCLSPASRQILATPRGHVVHLQQQNSLHTRQCQRNVSEMSASASTRWHFAFGAMLSQQRNSYTDCKSAQQCTTRGHPLPFPKLHPGPCSSVGMRRGTGTQTDRHRDGRDHHTFRVVYWSTRNV